MRIVFKLDADDLARFDRVIEQRQERGTNLRPAMKVASTDFMALEQQVFATQGRVILGSGWKKLNPKWADYRRSQGRGDRILQMTGGAGGRLRKSLTVPGAPYQKLTVTDDEMVVAITLGIATIHAKGSTITINNASGKRTVKVPRRRFVRLRREDRLRMLSYAQDYIETGRTAFRGLGL